jgi:hypothetical protein
LVTGTDNQPKGPVALGASIGPSASAALDPLGGGAQAWPAISPTGATVLDVHEQFPDGTSQIASLSAPFTGPISGLTIGPTGHGDAAFGFEQGSGSSAQIAVAVVKAPPAGFNVHSPNAWVRPARAKLSWDKPINSLGPLTYSVLLDGHLVLDDVHRLHLTLPARGLGENRYKVTVRATDEAGQQVTSPATILKVDDQPPAVSVAARAGGVVRLSLSDDASGVDTQATRVSFGDHTAVARGATATFTHTYVGPGRYEITVRCADYAGNTAVHHLFVRAR